MASREELGARLKEAIAAGSDDVFEIARKRFEAEFAGRDERQREHLRLADEMEARLRSLPRVGATFTAQALFHGAWAHRMMSTMTEVEERAWLAEAEDAA